MGERRFGGETGVAEVRYLEGPAVWAARERGEFSASLMEAAAGYTRPNRCARAVLAVWLRGGSNPPLACAHLHFVVVFRAAWHASGITDGCCCWCQGQGQVDGVQIGHQKPEQVR